MGCQAYGNTAWEQQGHQCIKTVGGTSCTSVLSGLLPASCYQPALNTQMSVHTTCVYISACTQTCIPMPSMNIR